MRFRVELRPAAAEGSPARFCIGEVSVAVSCEVNDALKDFGGLYEAFRVEEAGGQHEIDIQLRSQRAGWRKQYLILGDGEVVNRIRRGAEIMPFLEWGINARVMARRSDFVQLHAATMSHGGAGVIFAGTSGSGKSTLAAGLLTRGWKYFSDEFALIHPGTLRLHAFPKAICMKEGAFEVIRRLGLPLWGRRFYVKAAKGRVGYLRPHDVAAIEPVARPAPVHFVFLPRYQEGGSPRLAPISRAQAVFALAGCALNRKAFQTEFTSIMSDVVRDAQCYRLDTGPLEDTCRLIESVVAEEAAQRPSIRVA